MVHCYLDPKKHILMKFYLKFKSSHSRKCIWRCRLQKWWPSCLGLDVLNLRLLYYIVVSGYMNESPGTFLFHRLVQHNFEIIAMDSEGNQTYTFTKSGNHSSYLSWPRCDTGLNHYASERCRPGYLISMEFNSRVLQQDARSIYHRT